MAETEETQEVRKTKNDLLKWALVVLFSWVVYEAREIKADIRTLLIQRAADDQRNNSQDAEITKIWAVLNKEDALRSVEREPRKRN